MRNLSKNNSIVIITALFAMVMACSFAEVNNRSFVLKNTVITNESRIMASCLIGDNSNESLKNKLSGVHLGSIARPLGELVLTKAQLARKLGVLANDLVLPEKTVIKRQGSILRRDEIENKIRLICEAELGSSKKIELDFSRLPNHLVLPGNILSWRIVSNTTNKLGMRLFQLKAETDGGKYRQLVQAKVTMLVTAAQLVTLAKPGEKITEQLVRPKVIKLRNMRARIPLQFKNAIGKSLSRYKSAGTILRASDICSVKGAELTTSPTVAVIKKTKTDSYRARASKKSFNREDWLIKPGEQVDFRVKKGSICLSLPAKAIQGGGMGDRISLINLKNHRKITGTVVAEGRVENE